MENERIEVLLHPPLLRAAREVAHERDISLGQLIRDALVREVALAHRKARSPVRADKRQIEMLRARLATDFAYARNWSDLAERLRRHHMVLREAGGGLALFSIPGGGRLCKASDLGYSLQTLAQKYRAPFPGLKTGRANLFAVTTHPDETEVVAKW
ncbi:MAG: hypothetical protein KDK00_08630 [Rhodobacteraceae bacterium]|nr:hypothetical protein [Paracoccaceae bacterium]